MSRLSPLGLRRASTEDKWTAFLLSLAVPGAGQLLARSWSCLAWFGVAAVIAAAPALFGRGSALGSTPSQIAAAAVVALLSAEHAKRCLEPRRRSRHGSVVKSHVTCGPLRGSRVNLRIELDVPRPHGDVWAEVADLHWFACIDPFHSRLLVMGLRLEPGVDLVLEHRAFGVTQLRFGRLLRWDEGRGYAFSDLSGRDRLRGLPHVFFVTVEPAESGQLDRSRVRIEMRGKWTARWIPACVARCWLWYVVTEHARLLRAAL